LQSVASNQDTFDIKSYGRAKKDTSLSFNFHTFGFGHVTKDAHFVYFSRIRPGSRYCHIDDAANDKKCFNGGFISLPPSLRQVERRSPHDTKKQSQVWANERFAQANLDMA
jgi:hypothetical protein